MHHDPNIIARNRRTVEQFLSGTHSKSIDDAAGIDDTDWTPHALVADEQLVSARREIEATFAGIEADGRRVTFDGMVLYRMEDGLVAETWPQIYEMPLMREIGAIPAIAA